MARTKNYSVELHYSPMERGKKGFPMGRVRVRARSVDSARNKTLRKLGRKMGRTVTVGSIRLLR